MSTKPLFAVIFFGGIFFSMIFTIVLCELWDRHIRKQNARARIKQRKEAQELEKLKEMNADWIGIPFTEADI